MRAWLAHTFRSLSHRNYRLYWVGQGISMTGNWMQGTAQMWLVYRLTHSSLLLGLTGFMSQIPMFLFGLLGGATADRYPKKRILYLTQSLSALQSVVLAALVLTDTVQVWHVLVLAAVLGVLNAFDMPTRQSFVIETVDRRVLGNAIALNSFNVNLSRMIGPAVAGLCIASWGEGVCFLLNALSFAAVLASLARMDPTHPPRAARPRGSPLDAILRGLAYVRSRPAISRPLVNVGLMSLVAFPYAVLMPVFARDILHGGPRALGTLMSSIGIGAVVGAFALARRESPKGLGRIVGLSTALFGSTLVLFALSRSLPLSMALLALMGYGMVSALAGTNTLLQALTSDDMRGRVMSLHGMMFIGVAPFGALLAGAGAARFGAPATVAVGGAICAAAGAWFLRSAPSGRRSPPVPGVNPEEA
ncbi:MAG: MFS transporter [Candidatus Coatesbacteria bacterium]